MRSRAAIDCRYIRERASGIGAYVRALVDRLPHLGPEIDWLLLRHPRANGPLSTAPNVREQIVPYEPGGPVTMWALPDVVDLRGVDLFHATFNLAPARLPCPVVTTIHDLMWLDSPEDCRVPGPWGLVETLFWRHGIGRALRISERVLTVSEASRRRIVEHAPHLSDRIDVTPLAIDDAWRPPRPGEQSTIATARERYAKGAREIVLTVGQAAGYKNHDGVLRAFARAFPDDQAIHLVLVQRIGGSGPYRALAAELGLEGRVHFHAAMPFEDLRALMWGALCLCHPSHTEGFGLPVAEAMGTAPGVDVGTVVGPRSPAVTQCRRCSRRQAIAAGLLRLRAAAPPGRARTRGLVRGRERSWQRSQRAPSRACGEPPWCLRGEATREAG
ncbi:MAG: glycosyltransferase family 4 protein [Myxococcales bacterium]|nr:glycosyltransferase family 4 protein [Myxococcales bacterium]